jgi:hypothetical protein
VSRLARKCGSLDVSETSGPTQPVPGIALPFLPYYNCRSHCDARIITDLGVPVRVEPACFNFHISSSDGTSVRNK